MTAPMVNLTIEGRAVAVPAGTTILEAAKVAGVLVPHYCYHPGLPVAGVCRMCLVEVEKMPKLAPSCATTVGEGQVVHVYSEKALEARKGVLELLLINHPLDCPICDQSGECELQDYTFAEGRADSRYREPKRFNPVEDFGGDVMYVPNRCILCTRCVRFMDDLAHDEALCVQERGDRASIGKATEKDLTHPWAANVVDLCPVGALLSKDFLNKARAWELDRTASVCPNCAQGCNTIVETRDNVVMRFKPRTNTEVNQYFLCDEGRLDYRWLNRADRATQPMIDGVLADWEEAIHAAARLAKGATVRLVANASLSNEALYLLKRAFGPGVITVRTGAEAPLPGASDLALRADRAANATGAEWMGYRRVSAPLEGLGAGDVLVIADHDLTGVSAEAVSRAKAVIVIGTQVPAAVTAPNVVLPIANMAEEEGTFTNLRGRVQRFLQAKAAPGMARPSWFVLADLATQLGQPAVHFTAGAVFDALAKAEGAFAGLSYDTVALKGKLAAGATAGARA
ncbi:MAG: (2Fe-2S)-binding protein [Gemmatimonadaceae bacterium]|nr:(2Fe-2S)-binding protein [Gemmatimonadaceae bacterium]